MDTDKDERTGQIRKKLYAYLESKGLKVTTEVHNSVRFLIKEHSRLDNAELVAKTGELGRALSKATLSKDMKKVAERIKDHECVICGIPMTKKSEHEFVAGVGCPHLKGLTLCVG